MAQLNSSNIVNGNVISTSDILQLYDALTAGGGTTGVYNVSLSGSITGSATTSTSSSFASTATSASFSVSSSRSVSSSFATTASYAVSSSNSFDAQSSTQLLVAQSNAAASNLYAFAGLVSFINGVAFVSMSIDFPQLPSAGAGLGASIWVNITPTSDCSNPISVSYNIPLKVLDFSTLDVAYNAEGVYTGYIKP